MLDPKVKDADLRRAIYRRVSPVQLRNAVEESDRIIRPLDDHYFDFLARRYTYLRQFSAALLETLTFRASGESSLLRAVDLLRRLNAEHRRVLPEPEEAAVEFVPARWRPYVIDNPDPVERRHYFELCVLWELRGALRAGDVWLEGSRRYADPESYLIPRDRWIRLRAEVCRQLQASADGNDRLREREQELGELLDRVDALLAEGGSVRMDGNDLVVSPLEAEAEAREHGRAGTAHRRAAAASRIERAAHRGRRLDRFSDGFEHAGGKRATEPGTAKSPLCLRPRPGLQPRPRPGWRRSPT